jgi:hypothetical protein
MGAGILGLDWSLMSEVAYSEDPPAALALISGE